MFISLSELFQLLLGRSESCFFDWSQGEGLPVILMMDLRVDRLRAVKHEPRLVIPSWERSACPQQRRRRSSRPRKQTRLMSHKHRLRPNESGLPSPPVPGNFPWSRTTSLWPVIQVLGVVFQLKHKGEQVQSPAIQQTR